MRLKKYLKEDGISTFNSGEGFNEIPDKNQSTITVNITPFFDKLPKIQRRKKKKKRIDYKNEENLIQDMIDVLQCNRYLNEVKIVPDIFFNTLKSIGTKLGLKIKRSDSLFDYLSSVETNIYEIYNLTCLYLLADTSQLRRSLEREIISTVKKVNLKSLTAFMMQMDKLAFGLSSFIRHILMSFLGIEISTYNKWSSDIEYIITHLNKVKDVLLNMNPTKEEIDAFDNLYDIIIRTKKEIESTR
jgi:hypothetical protein